MLFWIENLFATLIVVFCVLQMFQILGPARKERKNGVKAGNILFLTVGLFLTGLLPPSLFYIRWIVNLVLITITMYFYKGFRLIRICYMSLFIVMLVELTALPAYFLQVLFDDYFVQKELWSLLFMIVSKLLLIGSILIAKAFFRKKLNVYVLNAQWFAFAVITFGTLLFNGLLIPYVRDIELPLWWFVFGPIAFLCINMYAFYLMSDLIQRQVHFLNEQGRILEYEKRLKAYETIANCLEEQRHRTHEYKNYIHCIYYLMEMGKQEEMRKYVNDLRYGMHLKNVMVCNTEHVLIDAIVNAKEKEATARGIVFQADADKLNHLDMQDEDVVVLFSNLFNNAVDAAENSGETPYIDVRIKEITDKLFICVKNSHANEIQRAEGEIITSKTEDSSNHGFGLRNVKNIVCKYEGECKVSYTEKDFMVEIEIPFPANV